MATKRDRQTVSILSWMWTLFVVWIPCIGFFFSIYWAFTGNNETRKNYFKALLVFYAIGTVLYLGVLGLGLGPEIKKLWSESLKPGTVRGPRR